MRKITLYILLGGIFIPVISQEPVLQEEYESKGQVNGKIYSNFNYSLHSPDQAGSFALTRAYFGFSRTISDHFSANVKVDVGSLDDVSEPLDIRQYTYIKNANITYNNGAVTAWGGMFDMVQFKVQENFWGYRYLQKSYLDRFGLGPSADLGAGVSYAFSNMLETDLVLSNGEGYNSPQLDDKLKAGWGVTVKPGERLIFRSYYSIFLTDIPQMTLTGFAGYDAGVFRLGGDYNYRFNHDYILNHNRFGFSVYGTYVFSEKVEFFLRYDRLESNIVDSSGIPWNLTEDGDAIVAGIQFTPVKNLHFTMDYQDWYEYAASGTRDQVLYLHLEVIF
ncbi:MAG: hypothetical protein WD578_13300 [Bacteroidales bacterium]